VHVDGGVGWDGRRQDLECAGRGAARRSKVRRLPPARVDQGRPVQAAPGRARHIHRLPPMTWWLALAVWRPAAGRWQMADGRWQGYPPVVSQAAACVGDGGCTITGCLVTQHLLLHHPAELAGLQRSGNTVTAECIVGAFTSSTDGTGAAQEADARQPTCTDSRYIDSPSSIGWLPLSGRMAMNCSRVEVPSPSSGQVMKDAGLVTWQLPGPALMLTGMLGARRPAGVDRSGVACHGVL
jgi:hypothetical protein